MIARLQDQWRQCLRVLLRSKRTLVLNLLLWPLLLAASWGWLYIPDTKAWHVALSAVTALAIAAVPLLLIAVTARSLFGASAEENSARSERRRADFWFALPLVLFGLLLLMGFEFLALRFDSIIPELSNQIASWITLTFRKPVPPFEVQANLESFSWFLRWLLIPFLLLPVLFRFAITRCGFDRQGTFLRDAFAMLANPLYWGVCAVFLLVGLQGFRLLLGWAPAFDSLLIASVSMLARFAVGYLLMVLSWLLLLAAASAIVKKRSENVLTFTKAADSPS
jgi:hypothetical protein